jgi:hypothetical protein
MWLCAQISDVVSFVLGLPAALFRRNQPESDEQSHWQAPVPIATKDAAEENR